MKLLIAKNVGFCTGVRRALDVARISLEKDPKPVQFLGEIIHNERVMKEIEAKGGKLVFDPKDVKSGTLIIRAHGTPPLPPLEKIVVEDATCPLVKRAQNAARTLSKKGYKVIIIGEKNHPEIKGIQGNIANAALVIENEKDAKKLKRFKKLGVIAQTTQSLEKVDRFLRILEQKTKKLKWINTLCPQVISRQRELFEIIRKTDGVLVVGSKTSANTQRLAEIVKKNKKRVWLINSLGDLKKARLKNISSLGVVSGTSAPNWEVEEIIKYLKNHDKKKKN